MYDSGDGSTAARRRTCSVFTVIDAESVLEIAQFTVGLAVVFQRGPSGLNRLGQNVADDRNQPRNPRPRDSPGFALGRNPSAMQDFADVDIAQPRDDPLIQKRGLDGGVFALQRRDQIVLVESVPQGLRPQNRDQLMLLQRCSGREVHGPKAAGVVEGHATTVRHVPNDVVVLFRGGVFVMELPQRIARDQNAPRHAEMDDQGLTRGQVREDILRPPTQRRHGLAGHPRGHVWRERPAQIGAAHLGMGNHLPFHHGQQPFADGFDLWQFRHVASPRVLASHCNPIRALYMEGEFFARSKRRIWSPGMEDGQKTTHFGFQTVGEDQKAGMVHGVFTNVASKYDIMNDVMSVGIHRIWKEAMMDWLAPRPGQKLLDVAGGTGDVSFKFLKRAGRAHATVLDMTESMLISGRERAEAGTMADQLDWVVGDAMALPFEDNSFDVYTISFGIRNVTRIPDALAEAYRVLRPGGRLMVLEFSQLPNPAMQKAYDLYSFNVIPRMGKLIANDADSYQYLVESIRNFPDQDTFAAMIRDAAFEQVSYRNLSMGIAALHSGWKL